MAGTHLLKHDIDIESMIFGSAWPTSRQMDKSTSQEVDRTTNRQHANAHHAQCGMCAMWHAAMCHVRNVTCAMCHAHNVHIALSVANCNVLSCKLHCMQDVSFSVANALFFSRQAPLCVSKAYVCLFLRNDEKRRSNDETFVPVARYYLNKSNMLLISVTDVMSQQ